MIVHEFQGLGLDANIVLGDRQTLLRASNLYVAERHFGDDDELHLAPVLDRNIEPCTRGVDSATSGAEDIDLPGSIELEV